MNKLDKNQKNALYITIGITLFYLIYINIFQSNPSKPFLFENLKINSEGLYKSDIEEEGLFNGIAFKYVQSDSTQNYMSHEITFLEGKVMQIKSFNKESICISDYHYLDSLKHGTTQEWYPSGNKKNIHTYSLGKHNSIWTGWYENGNKKYKKQYDLNTRHGKWTSYFDNNQIEEIKEYNNGRRIGIWEKYFYEGQKIYTRTYKNGKKHGVWHEWWKNGELKNEATYTNDKKWGKFSEWQSNGKLYWEGYYKNNKENGEWKYYNSRGKLIETETYNMGALVKIEKK